MDIIKMGIITVVGIAKVLTVSDMVKMDSTKIQKDVGMVLTDLVSTRKGILEMATAGVVFTNQLAAIEKVTVKPDTTEQVMIERAISRTVTIATEKIKTVAHIMNAN